jgi:hypothetical protein
MPCCERSWTKLARKFWRSWAASTLKSNYGDLNNDYKKLEAIMKELQRES